MDDVHGSREHPVTLKFQVIVNQTTEKNRPTCTENSVIYSRVIAISDSKVKKTKENDNDNEGQVCK